ncbi:TIGR01777 family oxidoreductase [Labedella endophytica]|uniref:TIGR01777 family protein n=1 Tax=Labedella endophytica TaxID=1523160 RepID=A0A433JT38_9MICO|nr:TIGR01777 family oxidoreductase [Labedella endophytica]RUR01084.1 TIGR01777 family protein [Labedella endophytica]
MRIVIAGAGGLIGRALIERLRADGDDVVRLVRRPSNGSDESAWDPDNGRVDPRVIASADAVVCLSGASIARLPWTPRYRRTILQSRLSTTSTLAHAIAESTSPPSVFVGASASGFYGSRPGEDLDESSPHGDGFLSGVTVEWEKAARAVGDATRLVYARTGIVVATDGVLAPLMPLTRFGLSGPLGGGRQYWPWVSLADEIGGIVHAIRGDVSGPINLVGPTPATAGELMRGLAQRLSRPYWLPVPAFAVKLALGDAGEDLLLVDQRIRPRVLEESGYTFAHTTVGDALDATLSARA